MVVIFPKFGFTKIKVGKKNDQMSETLCEQSEKNHENGDDEMTTVTVEGLMAEA